MSPCQQSSRLPRHRHNPGLHMSSGVKHLPLLYSRARCIQVPLYPKANDWCCNTASDKQILVESGILTLLRPDMAIMVDRGFLADDCVSCKEYRPCIISRETSDASRRGQGDPVYLRVHVERLILRLKERCHPSKHVWEH